MSKYMFQDKKMDYKTFLENIKEKTENTRVVFAPKECTSVGLNSLIAINDEEQKRKMIDVAIAIDKDYSVSYDRNANASHKLAYIFSAASMISNHYPLVKDLNNNELSLLSYFSFVVSSEHMQKHLELFASKDLLDAVLEKSPKREEQSSILEVIESRYYEFGIDLDDTLEFNKFKNECVSFVRNTSTEDLLKEDVPVEQILIECGF